MIGLNPGALALGLLAAALALGTVLVLAIRRAREASRPAIMPSPQPTPEKELAELCKSGGNASLRITGELRVSGNTVLPSGFVMDGSLTVLEGASLDALVEVHGNATLEPGAKLARPVLVHGDLTLSRGARVPACHVGGALHLHPEAKVDTLLECGTLFVHERSPAPASVA